MKNLNLPLFFRAKPMLKRLIRYSAFSLFLLFLIGIPQELQACMGTPAPPCGRSVFLGKFTPGTVVFPAGGGAINVPIGILPFAWWNPTGLPNAPICPQPVGATLTLTLTCFPSGTVIGPQAFPVVVPTTPGAQPVGGPVNFVIPAGVFPVGSPPQLCLVVGTYTVTFSDGTVLAFNGDTEVCITPPSPLDASVPRLDMQYLPTTGENYQTCRRGDQANCYFLIANNDPDLSVSLNLNSIGRQVAQLPNGISASDAYAMDVYSISLPEVNTDTYPAAFTDDLMPGELLAETDPSMPDPQALSRSINLQPCEAIIIGITMRSFGMCANGSCNERLVKVEGAFSNGDPALACASTLLVVDEAPAKTVLCEIDDAVKAGEGSMATWSAGVYSGPNGEYPHAQTFSPGNLELEGFLTTGDPIPDLFPSNGSSYTRINGEVITMSYAVNYNTQQCKNGVNLVQIMGINHPNFESIQIPIITLFGMSGLLNIIANPGLNQLEILAQGDLAYQGPLDLFFADPPPEFCIDPATCRTVTKASSVFDKSVFVERPAVSRLFDIPFSDPGCDTVEVFDNLTSEADWDATVDGAGVVLTSASGMGELEFCFDNLAALPVVPATTITYIDVDCPGALSTVRVPVAIRVKVDSSVNVQENYLAELDQQFKLHTAIPNPFTETTIIPFTLKEPGTLSLRIYNHLGQIVRELIPEQLMPVGDHQATWNGQNDLGAALTTGLYICELKINNTIQTSKLLLTR